MGDDGVGQPADQEPELVVDGPVEPVVGIDVVGGPDDFVAQFPGQLQRRRQLPHPFLHDAAFRMEVVMVGPMEMERLNPAAVPAQEFGAAVPGVLHLDAAALQGLGEQGAVGIAPFVIGWKRPVLVVVEGDAHERGTLLVRGRQPKVVGSEIRSSRSRSSGLRPAARVSNAWSMWPGRRPPIRTDVI